MLQGLLESGHLLAGVLGGFPLSRIQLLQFRQGQVRNFALTAGGPVDGLVMHQYHCAVFAAIDVELAAIGAGLDRPRNRGKRVLGGHGGEAAMGHHFAGTRLDVGRRRGVGQLPQRNVVQPRPAAADRQPHAAGLPFQAECAVDQKLAVAIPLDDRAPDDHAQPTAAAQLHRRFRGGRAADAPAIRRAHGEFSPVGCRCLLPESDLRPGVGSILRRTHDQRQPARLVADFQEGGRYLELVVLPRRLAEGDQPVARKRLADQRPALYVPLSR